MDAANGIKFWLQRKTTYKFIEPFAVDFLSAPALQAFVERIFSLCGLMTADCRNSITGNESIAETEQSTKVICLKLVEMTVCS